MPPVRSVTLRILGDGRDARAVMDWTNAEADKIDKRKPTLHINADIKDAQGPLATFRAEVARLTDKFYTFKFNANDSALNASLSAMMVKLAALQRLSDRWGAGQNVSNKALGEASAKVLGLSASYDALALSQQKAIDTAHAAALDEAHSAALLVNTKRDTAMASAVAGLAAGGGGGGGGGILGGLGASIPLFGGIGGLATSGWHIAIDALAEVAAIAVPATVAILAFGAALAATGPDLAMMYSRETAMYTATDILGQKMPGINTNLNQLSQTLKPGVFQAWGDAITVVNSQSGQFAKLSEQAVGWVDRFAAAVTVDIGKSTGTFHALVTAGAHDLSILGGILASVGGAFGHLFQAAEITHIAQDILYVVAAIAKMADAILKISPPWLTATALAIHGIYLWGGLAADAVFKVVGALGGIVGKIPGLSGVGAVMKDVPGALDRVAAGALSASSGLDFTVKGMRGVAVDAEGATVKTGFFKTALAGLSAVPVWGWVALGAVALGGLVWWLSSAESATLKWTHSLNDAITAASNMTSFNLMVGDLSQVTTKLSDSAKAADSTAKSFQGAGYSGRAMAVQIVSGAQQAHDAQQTLGSETRNLVDKMTSFGHGVEWIMTTFKVSYPEALAIADQAGVKLANGIIGMSKSAQDARQQILGLVTGFTQLQTPAGVAGKDFEALAYASNDITSKIDQLNSAWKSWEGTVTGTQTSFDTFAQGLNTMSDSAAVFTIRAGIMQVKNIPALKAAIDSLTPSGEALNQAFMSEATNLGNLEGAMRSANASQKDQTITMKAGIAALIPYAAGSKEATSVLYALAQQANYTGGDSIKSLSNWAGIKAPDALKLMKKAADNATTAASNLANTISNLLNVQFQNDVIQASGASAALQKYTTDLVYNKDKTRAGQADRQNLINDLIHAGLSADAARRYVDGLSTSLGKIPKSEKPNIDMTGTGKYTITGMAALTGNTNLGNQTLPTPTGHAAGFRVPGFGGGDKYPAYLEGGEAVVPKHLVAPIAPFLGANGVPGFSSGTYVGNVPGLTNFTVGMWNTFQSSMTSAMVNALKGGIQQAMAAATAGISNKVPNVGSGVMRWSPLVMQALSMEGLGSYLASQVLYQMMTESGGNPNAINLTDSNAAAGDPSRGLLQTIMSTFMAYHWPGTSYNIYDPLANIAAAINYARHRYGPTLMSGGMGMGSGHGYALGGVITEPISGVGLRSGAGYSFGENGPELVSPLSRVSAYHGGGGGDIYITVNAGDAVDPNAVAQSIHQMLRRYKTKKGGAPLGLG